MVEYDFLYQEKEWGMWTIYYSGTYKHPSRTKAWKELQEKLNNNEAFSVKWEIALPF